MSTPKNGAPIAGWHGGDRSSAALSCRRCGSNETKPLKVIHASGSSSGHGTGRGWVQGANGAPGHAVTFSTTTASITAEASAAAPPKKRSTAFALVSLPLVIGPIVAALGSMVGFYGPPEVVVPVVAVAGLAPVLIGLVLLPGEIEYNRSAYPRSLEAWSRTWACVRCGTRFLV